MIVTPADGKKDIEPELHSADLQGSQGGSSSQHGNAPLPDDPVPRYTECAFESAYVPTGGEEQPPDFTPYEAEFFISGREIVSHDAHLNQDGEALYRFLLAKSVEMPEYKMHARGTHTEHKTRTVYSQDQHGKLQSKVETYSETVTDFDFYIDLTPQISHGPVHWSVPDAEPAYRGEMYMQVDTPATPDLESGIKAGRRKARRAECKAAKANRTLRERHGLPPWVAPDPDSLLSQTLSLPPRPAHILQSSRSLRDWADEYCASDKLLKEFTYTKVVHGWNVANLEEAVTAAIRSVYSGHIALSFERGHDLIRVRPDNALARTLSNKWLLFLLWLLLLYPFIWLYKRFGGRGGGRWEVCGGAYALKTWQMQTRTQKQAPSPDAAVEGNGRWRHTADGWACLVGEREGEWFQRWEGRIRAAVRDRIQSRTALELVEVDAAAAGLDGYQVRCQSPYASLPLVES